MDPRSSRHALTATAAALLLAGCGAGVIAGAGSTPAQPQPPQQNAAKAASQPQTHAKAWMLQEAKSDDLLYITTTSNTFVDSYPQGRLVGELGVGGFYLCADKSGNVFLSQYTEGTYGIIEYAHAATTPTQTIKTAGPPWGCAVDPKTGDLAVAIPDTASLNHGELAIYKHARGAPQVYSDNPTINYIFFCRYDPSGNLFFDGTPGNGSPYLAELPHGSKQITNLTIANGSFYADSDIEWDGTYLAIADVYAQSVDRMTINGDSASIIQKVTLRHWVGPLSRQVWIDRGRLISNPGRHDSSAVWHYPQGGEPFKRLHPDLKDQSVDGIVVSYAKRQQR